jgi:hypothetical protein
VPFYQFVLGPAGGNPAVDLTFARNRALDLKLSEPSTASFVIDGRSEQAAEILELATEVSVFRDRELLFRGFVGATSDNITEDRHDVQVTVVDYRGRLDRIILDNDITYTTELDRNIGWELIDDAQAKTGGDLGITRGPALSGLTSRTITFTGGISVREALDRLASLAPGFDWDITPEREFVLFDERGSDKGVILDYGGLVSAVSVNFDPSTYANAVRVSGDPDATNAQFEAATDIGDRPEGRYETQLGLTDIVTNPTLAARATRLLAEREAIKSSFQVTLRNGDSDLIRWGGLDDIGLGDTCRMVVRSGRLDINRLVRVFEIRVTIGADNNETVTLTLDAPEETFVDRIRRQQARLEVLERSG